MPADDPAAALEAQLETWDEMLNAATSAPGFVTLWESVTAELTSVSAGHEAFFESASARRFDGRLAAHQRRYLAISERTEAESLVLRATKGSRELRDLAGTVFGRRTLDRLTEARTLLDLDRCQSIVVVGCGPFPAAALFFHHSTSARVIALEVEPLAAELAERVAARHASPRLEICREDGREHGYGNADCVYVVNQATPKVAVIAQIAATARPGVTLLVRDPFAAGRLLADSIDRVLPPPWRLAAAGAVDRSFLSRHLLLRQECGDGR